MLNIFQELFNEKITDFEGYIDNDDNCSKRRRR